eukprot:TRINITY_DN4426_c0_g1_i1.p1 TRINITY_DN4426_c0_g1~~TRINITY_DN4426_c0_g1_i1.p1  ORF type:complete len:532 (+),score=179.55 TRINITY_DN4426_c0_g1_i1:42-1598(+)
MPRRAILGAAALALSTWAADAETILIKGGTVVNEHSSSVADVLIEDGVVKEVGSNLKAPAAAKTVDAKGKYVMPGGIDPHTHLEMPFMGQVACDDFSSGHQAALAGGTTLHVDFALPVDGSLVKGFEAWQKKAKKANMDFAFHMAVTSWNEQIAKEMEVLVKKGVNSFKFFMAYKGALMINDEQMLEAFRKCKELGVLAQVHAENGDAVAVGQQLMIEKGITGPEGHALSRPAELEGEATHRAIQLARFIGNPLYVVHVMSHEAAEAVRMGREQGARVIGEPVLSGLFKDESELWSKDWSWAAAHVMSPPIRKLDHDGKTLKNYLKNRILSLVATDHAVFNTTQKAKGKHDFRVLPNGVNGLEERIPVLWEKMVKTGMLTPMDFVRVTSTEAARIYNVYPRKGAILPGSDADLYILNPKDTIKISAKNHHSNLDINVYEGWTAAKVETTLSGGRLAWHEGKILSKDGDGKYVETPPWSPHLFTALEQEEAYRFSENWKHGAVPVQRAGAEKAAHKGEL